MRSSMKKLFFIALVLALVLPMAVSARGGGEAPAGTTGSVSTGGAGGYHEAPMLAARVASGELPPVDQRLPETPDVAETVAGIGQYGGQMRTFNADLAPRGMWSTSLLRVPRDAVGQQGQIALDYKVAEDGLSMIVYLRPGMKWSDGEPFTAEDIRFMYEDIVQYTDVDGAHPRSWTISGQVKSVTVIDEYTAQLNAPSGIGAYPMQLATWFGGYAGAYQPKHYVSNWHIKYNPDANELAKEEGYENWIDGMMHHYFWGNGIPAIDVNCPILSGWIPKQLTTTTELYERNPYYFRVDSAGNQLPYIDTVIVQQVDPEVYQLKITSGDADLAWAQTTTDNLQLYKQSEAVGNYTVQLHPGVSGGEVHLAFANTHVDPVKRAVFNNIKFRQAVSVAVDRSDLNEAVYNGLGVERQYSPLPTNSYYKQEWGNYYAQYDPALANRLLDEVGLTARDSDGFRMGSNRQTFSVLIEYSTPEFTPTLEIIKEYWEAVGLKTTIKLEDGGLVESRMMASELDVWVQPNPSLPWCGERDAFQNIWTWDSQNMRMWWEYLADKNTYLTSQLPEGQALPIDWRDASVPASVSAEFRGEAPPAHYTNWRKTIDMWQKTEMGSAEYRRLAQQIFDYAVMDQMYEISYVGMVPQAVIVSGRLKNAPPPGWVAGMPYQQQYVSQWTDQMYLAQ